LDLSVGQVADADLALRLRASGQRLLLDPQAKMTVTPDCVAAASGFRYGLHAERLFLRHVPQGKWGFSLLAHACTVAADAVRGLPGPAVATQLLGRLLAWTSLREQRRQHERALDLIDALPARSSVVPRPHLPLAKSQLKREAA
jgi:hypothetical protein